jgi:hypothetical protein
MATRTTAGCTSGSVGSAARWLRAGPDGRDRSVAVNLVEAVREAKSTGKWFRRRVYPEWVLRIDEGGNFVILVKEDPDGFWLDDVTDLVADDWEMVPAAEPAPTTKVDTVVGP